MKNKLTDLELSILILHLIEEEIFDLKVAINKMEWTDNGNVLDAVVTQIYLKFFCYMEEWNHFKSLGETYPKVSKVVKALKPASKYLSNRENGINKVRHQIIAHSRRMKKTGTLSNFYEIALENGFPGQYTELALVIDMTSLITNSIKLNFRRELDDAYEKWHSDEDNIEIRNQYFSQEKFLIEDAQKIFADIEAKVLSNFRRIEREEKLLK